MSAFDIPPLLIGECSLKGRRDGDVLVAVVTGTADMRATEGIGSWLEAFHAEATRVAAAEVVVDMRELEFMNSSCFKGFVTWITTMREAEHRYRIKLLSNQSLHWQRRGLPTLRCFAADLISIE
jgi:hypothetical protein